MCISKHWSCEYSNIFKGNLTVCFYLVTTTTLALSDGGKTLPTRVFSHWLVIKYSVFKTLCIGVK